MHPPALDKKAGNDARQQLCSDSYDCIAWNSALRVHALCHEQFKKIYDFIAWRAFGLQVGVNYLLRYIKADQNQMKCFFGYFEPEQIFIDNENK